MSSDYYFAKWKKILTELENLVHIDLEYQETKANDKRCCDAAQRLAGVLAQYTVVFNEVLECLDQNLQLQKTDIIKGVLKAVVNRIKELKDQLRKLEANYYNFMGYGLFGHKITTYDTEYNDIPTPEFVRSLQIQAVLEDIPNKIKEIQEIKEKENEEDFFESVMPEEHWWEDEVVHIEKGPKGINVTAIYKIEKKISEETMKRKQLIVLIQAHEKTRQITYYTLRRNLKRIKWEKELNGTLNPIAPFELRCRAASIIQRVCRVYFELKRKKLAECKRDQLLDIKLCERPHIDLKQINCELKLKRRERYKVYETQWKEYCDEFKQKYFKQRAADISEDMRDYIRNWFKLWFDEVLYFYDIPKENKGGSGMILKEEVPTPDEWSDMYENYMAQNKANKNKTATEIKWEKGEAKREEMRLKREEHMKKKLEMAFMKKIMKNPTLHPGYTYPQSKKASHILQMLQEYRKSWRDLDFWQVQGTKEKSVKEEDNNNICMEVKKEIQIQVDEEMRNELKQLKRALKQDYKRNDQQMPETIKENKGRRKKKKRRGKTINDKDITNKLLDLALKGIFKECPKTNFEDFFGDHNFAGDILRSDLQLALPFGGEIRSVWWEKCREACHGSHRILLVGAPGSGKTTLVHILATVNDAVLFELDLQTFPEQEFTKVALQQLVNNLAVCAKASQPSVIYVKHVEELFVKKVKDNAANQNLDLLRTYLIRKLFKKIHKTDQVTIIGSCTEPWLMSKRVVKKFPNVILLPHTSYSTVVLLLKEWVINNRIVPVDFDVHSLAYVLQGYSFGYLKRSLDNFLTPDRIVKIAAYGLSPLQIYNYILEDDAECITDYTKYLKWYSTNTYWGKREKKILEEQKEFKKITKEWMEKMKKKKMKK